MMQLNLLVDVRFDENAKVPLSAKDLILKMLRKNPKERISTTQALQHDFFFENIDLFSVRQIHISPLHEDENKRSSD
jgi:serine/threonine protein kinase